MGYEVNECADTRCEAEWLALFDAIQSSGAGFDRGWRACTNGAFALFAAAAGYEATADMLAGLGIDCRKITIYLPDVPVPPKPEAAGVQSSDAELRSRVLAAYADPDGLQARFGCERASNALLNVSLSLGLAQYGFVAIAHVLTCAASYYRDLARADAAAAASPIRH